MPLVHWTVAVAAAVLVGACGTFRMAADAARVFPSPDGLPASPHYRVEVQTSRGWEPSFVHISECRTDGAGAGDQPGRSMSWTTFETAEPVRVRVTAMAPAWRPDGVVVRPTRFGIRPEGSGTHAVEFTLIPGAKVSVEFPDAVRADCFSGPPDGIPCVVHALMVFADRPRPDDALDGLAPSEVAVIGPGVHGEVHPVVGLPGRTVHRAMLRDLGGCRAVVFAPGVHELGYWQVPESVGHVHLEPGAVVFGAIDVLPEGRRPGAPDLDRVYRDGWHQEPLRPAFKLTGPGILSGARLPWHLKKDLSHHPDDHWWAHVKLVQLAAENVTVRDVTLVDSPYWCVSFLNDADSRTRGVFENIKIVGSWTYNNDGLPVPGGPGSRVRDAFIHANDDALKLYHTGGRVEDCVVWQGSNGAVFQFGWFAKTVRDVLVRRVDVIHDENWYGVGQASRAVISFADASGQGVIEHVVFEDVHVEGRILRLFGLRATGGQVMRNWRFRNLTVGGLGAGRLGDPGRNYFLGEIGDFRFEGFRIGSSTVADAAAAAFDLGPDAGAGFRFDPSGHPGP